MSGVIRGIFTNKLHYLAATIVLCGFRTATAENWHQWRGPDNSGSVEGGTYPVRFSADKVLWKAPLPGKGCSTPVVWEKRIYLTAPSEGRDAVIAFDFDGKQLWKTVFEKESPGKHRNGSGSNASPVTDGKAVFVYFKSGTLAAVSVDGKTHWKVNLNERFGSAKLFWDHGTSPVLTKKHVVMTRMHKGESWLAAFDKETGEMKWKEPRNYDTPVENDHGYTTPIVMDYQGKEALLVWGGEHLTIHDADGGKVLWSCDGFNPDSDKLWPTVATPAVVGDIALVPFGRNDKGAPRLHGIKLTGKGEAARLWKRSDFATFVPTPATYRKKFYMVGDKGRVSCLDPATGKADWTEMLPKNRNRFYASPLIAGGKIYAPREDGVVFVASIDDGFKLLAENDMGESIIASPVPVENRLLLRGIDTLFCVGEK